MTEEPKTRAEDSATEGGRTEYPAGDAGREEAAVPAQAEVGGRAPDPEGPQPDGVEPDDTVAQDDGDVGAGRTVSPAGSRIGDPIYQPGAPTDEVGHQSGGQIEHTSDDEDVVALEDEARRTSERR